MNKFDFQMKKERLKERVVIKFRDALDWIVRHRDFVVTVTPILVGGVATIFKVTTKRANLQKQESIKNLYCYDRSLGHYWRLRRELSNKEWLEIDRRKKNGERLSDILAGMKVLK